MKNKLTDSKITHKYRIISYFCLKRISNYTLNKENTMITSKLAVCFTALTLLLLGSCVTPEEPLPTPPPVTKETITDYQPTLDRQIAYYRDTVHISGKNFGTRPTRIAVYLDSIYILPLNVVDTRVTFIIPSNLPLRKYNVSIKILDDEIKDFATLELLGFEWGYFNSLQSTVRLFGYNIFTVVDSGTIVKKYIRRSSEFSYNFGALGAEKFTYAIENKKLVYNYTQYVPIRWYPQNDKTISESGFQETSLHIEIDTSTKTVANLSISDTTYHNISAAVSVRSENSSMLSIEIKSASYKDIDNGIEIYINSKELEQSIRNVIYRRYKDFIQEYNGIVLDPQNWNFASMPPYESDNYIKIVLLRKN